jgi:voltage-gated sodium channel
MTSLASPDGGWRARLCAFVESPRVQNLIMALIVINAVTLGLETSSTVMKHAGAILNVLDSAVLAVFVVEIAAKILGRGLGFFRNGWNLFDFAVVGIALVPSAGPFSVLRALRVLRVLRLISIVPKMRRVIEALIHALPGLGSIGAILLLIFYVSAVIATNLYGDRFPALFGTLGHSMYSLFQIMTLEGWSAEIVRPVMEAYPYSWTFFIPFILIATFTVLNLFIAIIVSAMQERAEADHKAEIGAIEEAKAEEEAVFRQELGAIRRELADIRALIERGDVGRER